MTKIALFTYGFAATGLILGILALFVIKPDRSGFYHSPLEIAAKVTDSVQRHSLAEKKIELYNEVNSDLDSNRFVVAILCCAGIALLVSRLESLDIPFAKITVTRDAACWLLPLVLLYAWFDFGYLLNRNIDSRLVAMRLIDAAYGLVAADPNYIKNHYTTSRAGELEDNGLVDTWFWNFYNKPSEFPVERRGWYNSIVPACSMAWYGAMYGLLHALVFLLPFSIPLSVVSSKRMRILVWSLILLSAATLLASHITFFVAGRHWNWFQASVFGFMLTFVWLLHDRAAAHHEPGSGANNTVEANREPAALPKVPTGPEADPTKQPSPSAPDGSS